MIARTAQGGGRLSKPPTAVGVAGLVILGLAFWTGPGRADASGQDEEFVAGSGKASAQILRVGPSQGQLSLSPTAGASLASFLGSVGIGESRSVDWAALEGTVRDQEDTIGQRLITEDLYPNLKVASTAEDSSAGRHEEHPPFVQDVRASDDPQGEAVTTLMPFGIPGVLHVGGGTAEAFAGLVRVETDAGETLVREARGSVDIPRIELGGGAVVLEGLHWEAVQRTDSNDDLTPETNSSFVVGAATIEGERQEGPLTSGDLETLVGPINEALAPTGLLLDLPGASSDGGAAALDPLAVRIKESQLGRTVLAPVLDAVQPTRDPIMKTVFENCEDCSGAVLVTDVTVGVLSGASNMYLELGGAFGFTEGQRIEDRPSFDFGGRSVDPPQVPTPGSGDPSPSDPPTVASGRGIAPPPTATEPPPPPTAVEVRPDDESELTAPSTGVVTTSATSSVVTALLLLGLAALSAMLFADYRRIRLWRRGVLGIGETP